jgi:hypothetical protein
MSHELATTNDRTAMTYFGQLPWHGLGTKLDNPATGNGVRGSPPTNPSPYATRSGGTATPVAMVRVGSEAQSEGLGTGPQHDELAGDECGPKRSSPFCFAARAISSGVYRCGATPFLQCTGRGDPIHFAASARGTKSTAINEWSWVRSQTIQPYTAER